MHLAQLRPNASIGPYQIERLLAKGGMGQLYLARHGDERVVLKLLRDQVAEDDEFRSMFLHEARIGALLDHPSIARIVDAGELDDVPYIAVEYIDGPPLNELMSRLGMIGKGEAIAIVVRVAEAIFYAHEATDEEGRPLQVVHRDVTPQNILVPRSGGVKLIDFGVARSTTQEHRTSTGVLKGKLAYMAPEQFRGETSNRSDIFSLGVVLWELLTGRRLFKRRTEAEVFSAVLIEPIPALGLGGELDEALQPIVDRTLERDPRRRYQTAGELARDLRSAARELALGCGPAELAADERADERPDPNATELSDWTEISVEIELPDSDLTGAATPSALQRRNIPIARPSRWPGVASSPPPARRRRTGLFAALSAAFVLLMGGAIVWASSPGAGDHIEPPREASTRVAAGPVARPEGDPPPAAPVAEPQSVQQDRAPSTEEAEPPPAAEPLAEAAVETPAVPDPPAPRRSRGRRGAPGADRPAAPVGNGQLYLDSDPWSTVRLGTRSLGQTPIVAAELPAGRHTLRLTDPEGESHRVRVDIHPNAPTKRFVRLR